MTIVAAAPIRVRMSRIFEAALVYANVSPPESPARTPSKCHASPSPSPSRRPRILLASRASLTDSEHGKGQMPMVVQRDRPAETLPDVILRGQSAAHGLSCPSGHAMVIFAITALVAPYFKGGERSCLGRWPPRSACHGCTSGRTSPWTSPPAPSPAGSRCVILAVGTGGIGTETASAGPSGCPAWPTLNP
jgi:hypothetical protein